ncbi:efflux RND transporter periplasmic adaptor subunit, partial [Pseudomonas aeruginosa]
LAVVQQINPVYVNFTQSSSEAFRLRRAMEQGKLKKADGAEAASVEVRLDDGTAYELKGKLLFTDLIVDSSTGQVTLRAEVPNPKGLLLPGMYVRVTVGQGVDPAAILVPQRAVQRSTDGQAHVLVVDGQDTLQMRPVQTAAMHGAQWQISAGLKAGERVVVGRMAGLQPGARVQVTALSDAAASPTAGLSGTFSASGSSATSSD